MRLRSPPTAHGGDRERLRIGSSRLLRWLLAIGAALNVAGPFALVLSTVPLGARATKKARSFAGVQLIVATAASPSARRL